MTQNNASFDYAFHSNYLIHWTGKDFDETKWYEETESKTDKNLTQKYIERFCSILKYGLWMTEDIYSYKALEKTPKIAQTCFTELRLSHAREHAKKFGRLGIGFKRPFVFEHGGRPVVYYDEGRYDPFLDACKEKLNGDPVLNFFKPMKDIKNSKGNIVNKYNLYDESEWRIIKTEKLLEEKLIIDPKIDNKDYHKNLSETEQQKLKYLIPIRKWLAMIIYPSLEVKRAVYEDNTIRETIRNIIENQPESERNIWSIELDLDACRNF